MLHILFVHSCNETTSVRNDFEAQTKSVSEKEKFFEFLVSGEKRETFEYITYFAYGNVFDKIVCL